MPGRRTSHAVLSFACDCSAIFPAHGLPCIVLAWRVIRFYTLLGLLCLVLRQQHLNHSTIGVKKVRRGLELTKLCILLYRCVLIVAGLAPCVAQVPTWNSSDAG
jgi:hypothetical protein